MKPFLNIDQASEFTKLKAEFIQKCCEIGLLATIKTGEGKYIINIESLKELSNKMILQQSASLPFRAIFAGNEKMQRLLDLIYGDPDEFV